MGCSVVALGHFWHSCGAPSSCSVSARLYCPACINGLNSRTKLCSRSAEHATSYVRSSATAGEGAPPHGGGARANLSSSFACFCRWLGSGFVSASGPRARSREVEPSTGAVLSRVTLSLSCSCSGDGSLATIRSPEAGCTKDCA
eukprot:scaffold6902_cov73-Phaeocystis_antarctica.AAC.2